MNNDYSAYTAREQYAAARWFCRTRQGGFVAMPNGIPRRVWDAAYRNRFMDGTPADPLSRPLLLRAVHGGWWAAQAGLHDSGQRNFAVGPRTYARMRLMHQRRAAERTSNLFIEYQSWA